MAAKRGKKSTAVEVLVVEGKGERELRQKSFGGGRDVPPRT